MLRRIVEALDLMVDLEMHLSEQGARDRRDVIAGAIGDRLRGLTSEAAIDAIAPTGAWVVQVRSLGDALDDPAVLATGIIRDVETPYGGKYRVVVEPLKLSASPLIFSRPAPNLGEHTRAVLAELGYGRAEVDALMAAGAAFAVPGAAARSLSSAESRALRRCGRDNAISRTAGAGVDSRKPPLVMIRTPFAPSHRC